MSSVDPAWQEWAEKAASEAAWQAKCREWAGMYWREHYARQEASGSAGAAVAEAKPTQGLPSVSQEAVLQLLQREDERMLAAAACDLVNSLAEHQIDKTAEQLADQILAEVKAETLAYKSKTRLRLRRLINYVYQWQEKCPDNDERTQLVGICTELLHLCDHLGIIRPSEDGGAE